MAKSRGATLEADQKAFPDGMKAFGGGLRVHVLVQKTTLPKRQKLVLSNKMESIAWRGRKLHDMSFLFGIYTCRLVVRCWIWELVWGRCYLALSSKRLAAKLLVWALDKTWGVVPLQLEHLPGDFNSNSSALWASQGHEYLWGSALQSWLRGQEPVRPCSRAIVQKLERLDVLRPRFVGLSKCTLKGVKLLLI